MHSKSPERSGRGGGLTRGRGRAQGEAGGAGAGAPGATAAAPPRVLAPARRLRRPGRGREAGWEARPRGSAEVANIGTCRSGRPRHCCHPGGAPPCHRMEAEISLPPRPPSPPPLRTPPTQPHPNPGEGAASAGRAPPPQPAPGRPPSSGRAPTPPHPTPGRASAARPPTQHCAYQPAGSAGRTRSGRVTSGVGGGVPRPGFCFTVSVQPPCQRPCQLTPERASRLPAFRSPVPFIHPGPSLSPWRSHRIPNDSAACSERPTRKVTAFKKKKKHPRWGRGGGAPTGASPPLCAGPGRSRPGLDCTPGRRPHSGAHRGLPGPGPSHAGRGEGRRAPLWSGNNGTRPPPPAPPFVPLPSPRLPPCRPARPTSGAASPPLPRPGCERRRREKGPRRDGAQGPRPRHRVPRRARLRQLPPRARPRCPGGGWIRWTRTHTRRARRDAAQAKGARPLSAAAARQPAGRPGHSGPRSRGRAGRGQAAEPERV